jgi:chromosome segregation ATPase
MHSIPHSKTSSLTRLNTSTKLRKTLQPSNSIILVNNDLSRYDDLIKKARETIYKFQNNTINNSRSKEKILNTSIQNIERKNSNYSVLLSSQRDSREDIRTEYSNYSNLNIENYYKNVITQLKTDSNIQNERMKSLENKNKQNELDLIDNERERGKLEDKVKILQKRLNETKNLYDDLRRQKENLENNYDQLRFDYKNDMKKAEMVSTLV